MNGWLLRILVMLSILLAVAVGFWSWYAGGLIDRCGNIGIDSYKIRPYLKVAKYLQGLGEEEALRKLRAWSASDENGDKVIILCRMLFKSKAGRNFRRPSIGAAFFSGGTNYQDWPLEPIAIHEGVPFLIVSGYALAGYAEPAERYLEYCVQNCEWSDRKYRLQSHKELEGKLESFIKSSMWKRALTEREIGFLRSQIQWF